MLMCMKDELCCKIVSVADVHVASVVVCVKNGTRGMVSSIVVSFLPCLDVELHCIMSSSCYMTIYTVLLKFFP